MAFTCFQPMLLQCSSRLTTGENTFHKIGNGCCALLQHQKDLSLQPHNNEAAPGIQSETMSIAEFCIENGIDPSDPWGDYSTMGGFGCRKKMEMPKPERDPSWKRLCGDSVAAETERGEMEGAVMATNVRDGDACQSKDAPPHAHRGALAPPFVFAPVPVPTKDDLASYQKRLHCALLGKFCCIPYHKPAEDWDGIPQCGERYSWRYWDSAGNVYEDKFEKCRQYLDGKQKSSPELKGDLETHLDRYEYRCPGDFKLEGKPMWMCDKQFSDFGLMFGGDDYLYYGDNRTILGPFWDAMWMWRFQGSTNQAIWDKCLARLAHSAGVKGFGVGEEEFCSSDEEGPKTYRLCCGCSQFHTPGNFSNKLCTVGEKCKPCADADESLAKDDRSRQYPFTEVQLDELATKKGWTRISCSQPALASYKRENVRLNFYLSTGTVGSCLQHPAKGRTQLFRRQMDLAGANGLFENPRIHTGKGYYRKMSENDNTASALVQNSDMCGKRKRDNASFLNNDNKHRRTCNSCSQNKSIDNFSKNQRRKGTSARCQKCISALK